MLNIGNISKHQIEIPKSRIGTPPKFTEDVVMIACEGAKDYDDVAARLGIDGSYVYTLNLERKYEIKLS